MFREKRRTIAHRPAIRSEENDFTRAHYVAKELTHRYKIDPRFVRAELSVDGTGPFVKFFQRFGDITPEFTQNGTRVISFCKEETRTAPDADFWGNGN